MLKLQSAPPRRVINWYRVAAYAAWGLLALGIIACAVWVFPYHAAFFTDPDAGQVNQLIAADGYGFTMQVIGFIGSMVLFLVGLGLFGCVVWLAWKILQVIAVLFMVWGEEIKEHDKRAKEYSGYHD